MEQTLLEKHEPLIVEIAKASLSNMEMELGKKYKDNQHQVSAGLTDDQYKELKEKYDVPAKEFAELYSEFMKMKPTQHLKQVMDAFTSSGGNVDIEPVYDEKAQSLSVSVSFVIDGKTIEKIEGLSEIEDLNLRMSAMIQIDTVLSGSDSDMAPSF